MQAIKDLFLNFDILRWGLIFFIVLNVLTFFLYIIDKRNAVKNKWRIRESTLIYFTLAFGGIGALLGMCLARHKTKKWKFRIAVAIGLLIALIPIIYIISFANDFVGNFVFSLI